MFIFQEAVYERATAATGSAAQAPLMLFGVVSVVFPRVRNLGCYVVRKATGENSLSLHAEGRAIDFGLNAGVPEELTDGNQLFQALTTLGVQSGLQEVIWNRKIWTSVKGLKAYSGADPHTKKMHVGFHRAGSKRLDTPIMSEESLKAAIK